MITHTIELISPAQAEEYLKANKVNRQISPGRVKQYADDMKAGLWKLNDENIRFNSSGLLIDGQHRLKAISASGCTVAIGVTRGIDDSVNIYDRGRQRRLEDSMLMDSVDKTVANARMVALAKLHYMVQFGARNVSDGAVKEFLMRNIETIKQTNDIRPKKTHHAASAKRVNVDAAYIALPAFYALKADFTAPETIKSFLEVVSTGIPADMSQTAAIIIRNDILGKAVDGGSISSRIKSVYQVEKALSDFCAGYKRKVSYVSWNQPIFSNNEKCRNA